MITALSQILNRFRADGTWSDIAAPPTRAAINPAVPLRTRATPDLKTSPA